MCLGFLAYECYYIHNLLFSVSHYMIMHVTLVTTILPTAFSKLQRNKD